MAGKRPPSLTASMENGEVLVPGPWKEITEKVPDFVMRPTDVIVDAYPKSGTTWMQEIVWLVCNEADVETAKSVTLGFRYGFLDAPDIPDVWNGPQAMNEWPKEKTRFLKSHLPFQFLPKELQSKPVGKIVCAYRNPKDVCVSFYHFQRMNLQTPDPGTWDEYVKLFSDNGCVFGSWFEHVHGFWEISQKRPESIYFVSYESLKKDLKAELKKMAKFLEKELSEEQIDAIAKHCTFESMKDNNTVNYSHVAKLGAFDFKVSKFMRKGEVGDWKNHFSKTQNDEFDRLFKERTKGWDLKIDFE